MLSPTQLAQRDGKLTAGRLRELLNYDPETGVFTRRKNEHGGGATIGSIVGTRLPTGHIRICVDGVRYYAHRLAWLYVYGAWPAGLIDHADNDGGNNRIANLREADKRLNRLNAKTAKNNSVGLKGVTRLKSGRLHARLRVDGSVIYLGTFDTKEQAHAAYLHAAMARFGNFVRGA